MNDEISFINIATPEYFTIKEMNPDYISYLTDINYINKKMLFYFNNNQILKKFEIKHDIIIKLYNLKYELKQYFNDNISTIVINSLIKDIQIQFNSICINNYIFENIVINNKFVRYAIEKETIETFFNNNIPFRLNDLKNSLPTYFCEEQLLLDILNSMVHNRKLMIIEDKYERYLPTIKQFIENISNDRHREMVKFRMEGLTLEEIGTIYNVTRERVRQIISKILKKIKSLYEDRYSTFFEKYNINKVDFIEIFDIDELSYGYLNYKYKRKNSIDFIDILKDEDVTKTAKYKAQKILDKDYIFINNFKIYKSRSSILKYILKEYSYDGVAIKDLEFVYNTFIEENNIKGSEFDFSNRYFETTLVLSKSVLLKKGNKLRYYDIYSYNINEFITSLNLNKYIDIEISTLKIFMDNEELMKEYNIYDEYELHNLLKKNLDEKELNVKFGRTPIINFGNGNRDMQILDMLLLLAPIKNTDFASQYENEYGVRSDTVLANFFKCIGEYFYDGYFRIDYKQMDSKIYLSLKRILTEEFYTIDEIKNIFSKIYPMEDLNLINSLNLKNLNFKVYSKYVLSDKYFSLNEFINKTITKKDLFDIKELKKINQIQQYYICFKELKDSLQILEYEPSKYINIRRLENNGVEKIKLRKYINLILKYNEDDYFTIKSINNINLNNEIKKIGMDNLGLNEYFFSSLLTTEKSISYLKTGKTFIFNKNRERFSKEDYVIYLLYNLKSIDIYELLKYLKNKYGVIYDKQDLSFLTSSNVIYYNRVMDKVYINKDEFYKEF